MLLVCCLFLMVSFILGSGRVVEFSLSPASNCLSCFKSQIRVGTSAKCRFVSAAFLGLLLVTSITFAHSSLPCLGVACVESKRMNKSSNTLRTLPGTLHWAHFKDWKACVAARGCEGRWGEQECTCRAAFLWTRDRASGQGAGRPHASQ